MGPRPPRSGSGCPLLPLLLLSAGCVQPKPSACCDPLEDTATDDSAVDSTPDSVDTSDTSIRETGDTSEPSDTGSTTPLPGSFSVTGSYKGAPVGIDCDETTGAALYSRYWGSSLGNVSGGFSCANEAGQRVTVSYISPSEGEWADTSDGKSWIYEDGAGDMIAWGAPDATTWALVFTHYGFVDATTVQLDGSLTGSWSTDGTDAEALADLTGTFALNIPCTSGC